MKKLIIFFSLLFPTNLFANDKVVLECFSLTGDYEFKYYGIENDDLFYVNKNKKITKIPYEHIKVKGNTMYALTPDNALSFTLGRNFIEVERFPKKGDAIKYGCSRLSGRSLKDFINK